MKATKYQALQFLELVLTENTQSRKSCDAV